ncbi:MAG TPA: hypothetical protein VFL14_00215, partial [Xanthomonadales bacterium]|nr:hypothetical protein [Xanthomonadales bacterium]
VFPFGIHASPVSRQPPLGRRLSGAKGPPVALAMLDKLAPGSSMTWMLELLVEDVASLPLVGWRVDVHLDAAARGYTSQHLVVRAADGTAVAMGAQSMVVFG